MSRQEYSPKFNLAPSLQYFCYKAREKKMEILILGFRERERKNTKGYVV
jgi:hypothetical protein